MKDSKMEDSPIDRSIAGYRVPQIPQLPDEIVLQIIKYSAHVESGNFQINTSLLLCCRRWNQIAQSILWRDMLVDIKVWPWVASRLARFTTDMVQLQHLSITDQTKMDYQDTIRRYGELSGEGLHDILMNLPSSLRSLELSLHGIEDGAFCLPICDLLIRAMRNLTSMRLASDMGETAEALTFFSQGLTGIFPTLEQLSVVTSQLPERARASVSKRRFEIIENIAKRIARAKSNGRFPKLQLCRITSFNFLVHRSFQQDIGIWVSNEFGENTVHVFDPIRNVVINSPLVLLCEVSVPQRADTNAMFNRGIRKESRMMWTQHISWDTKLHGPSRAVRHEDWQDDVPEAFRPNANLIDVIGTMEELMDVWDGHQWVTTEQGVRVPRLALDGSFTSRGLSVAQTNSEGQFNANANVREMEDAALEFLQGNEEALDLDFVPDVYELVNDIGADGDEA